MFDNEKIQNRIDQLKEELNHLDNSEVWKPVKDYENQYLVSKLGQVFLLQGKKLLQPRLLKGGKYYVTLNRKGNRKTIAVEKLVATAFNPPRSNVKLISGKRMATMLQLEPDDMPIKIQRDVVGKGLVKLRLKTKIGGT